MCSAEPPASWEWPAMGRNRLQWDKMMMMLPMGMEMTDRSLTINLTFSFISSDQTSLIRFRVKTIYVNWNIFMN